MLQTPGQMTLPEQQERDGVELRREEAAGGLRYAHFRADANTGRLLEIASFPSMRLSIC
jgi:hypothetical protein